MWQCDKRVGWISWTGEDVSVYERLKKRTTELQKDIPAYIKEIIEKHM